MSPDYILLKMRQHQARAKDLRRSRVSISDVYCRCRGTCSHAPGSFRQKILEDFLYGLIKLCQLGRTVQV